MHIGLSQVKTIWKYINLQNAGLSITNVTQMQNMGLIFKNAC